MGVRKSKALAARFGGMRRTQGAECRALPLSAIKPTGFKPTCARCDTYWWK